MAKIDVYLAYNGQCEQAFKFYQSIIGGEIAHISRYKDAPPQPGMAFGAQDQELVMHVSLTLGKDSVLMGCDRPSSMGKPASFGDNFSLSFLADSKNEADRIFSALSESGRISMPMALTFWNSYFGMVTDKFGIHWMISANPE